MPGLGKDGCDNVNVEVFIYLDYCYYGYVY